MIRACSKINVLVDHPKWFKREKPCIKCGSHYFYKSDVRCVTCAKKRSKVNHFGDSTNMDLVNKRRAIEAKKDEEFDYYD